MHRDFLVVRLKIEISLQLPNFETFHISDPVFMGRIVYSTPVVTHVTAIWTQLVCVQIAVTCPLSTAAAGIRHARTNNTCASSG